MIDMFAVSKELNIPCRYDLTGKVHGSPIQRLARTATVESVALSPFSSNKVQALCGEIDGQQTLFLSKKTAASLNGLPALLSVGYETEENLSQKSEAGEIDWFRPKPHAAGKLTKSDCQDICRRVRGSWKGAFSFQEEERDASGVTKPGLRPPQIGALHACFAHWSVSPKPATVVMPTGTGKTETMLSLLVSLEIERLMVVVPNAALRDQIADKFLTLGILKSAGVLAQQAELPVVATLAHRPTSNDEVDDIFLRANVIVTTMQVAGQCDESIQQRMAEHCTHLFIDEAHHIAARTWHDFKKVFDARTVVQFTATPFRTDGKKVDGKFIYVYPLAKAQAEGYFRPINFEAVQGLDESDADNEIVKRVGNQLRTDLRNDFDHLVMARARNIDRAIELHRLYEQHLGEFNPVIVHSRMRPTARKEAVEKLKNRHSRIIVCVDMLGEGFDLPQLKISGLHDRHKSVAITLQFTGRFTRDSKKIGNATVIANIEQSEVDDALRSLYAEDADWNYLLTVLSEAKTGRQIKRAEVRAIYHSRKKCCKSA